MNPLSSGMDLKHVAPRRVESRPHQPTADVSGDSVFIEKGPGHEVPYPISSFGPGAGVSLGLGVFGLPSTPQLEPAGPQVATEKQVKDMHLGIGARAVGRNMATSMMLVGSSIMGPSSHMAFLAGQHLMPLAQPLITANPNSAVVRESHPLGTNYFIPDGPTVSRGPDQQFSAMGHDAEKKFVSLKTEVHGDMVTVFNADGSLTTLNTSDLTLGVHTHQSGLEHSVEGSLGPFVEGSIGPAVEGSRGPSLEGGRGPSVEGVDLRVQGQVHQSEGFLIR